MPSVFPAEAGVQDRERCPMVSWAPAFAGELGTIDIQRFVERISPTKRSVTPDSFRGPRFRELKSLDFAEPWMPERVRHDEKLGEICPLKLNVDPL